MKGIAENQPVASMLLMGSGIAWDDQQAFLAVVETGSLSGAARQLRVAQPTVRHRVEALEQALGTVLFTRSPGGLVPTEQARALAVHARAMSLASEAFVRAASGPSGEVAGTVRLSVSEFVGVEVLPAMVRRLRDRHPGLAVEVELSNEPADLLGQEADVAVRMRPPREGELVAKRVDAIPLGFFAHREYVARRGAPATLDELASHDLVGPDRSRADLDLAEVLHPALTRRAFVFRTDSHPAQLAAVRAGVGIGVVQRPAGLADPALSAILPDLVVGALPTWIVAHRDLRRLPRVGAVFKHLVDEFTALGRVGPSSR